MKKIIMNGLKKQRNNMKTLDRYRESVRNLIDRLTEFPYIIQCPARDLSCLKDLQKAAHADLVFSDVNYETDTCYIIKNRWSSTARGTVGLTLLCLSINESIEHHHTDQQ
jgi:hypothetical protein